MYVKHTTMVKTVKAYDLKVGDVLIGSGSTVIVAPVLANPCGLRTNMYRKTDIVLTVKYANGKESTRVWNKNTTMKVNRFDEIEVTPKIVGESMMVINGNVLSHKI